MEKKTTRIKKNKKLVMRGKRTKNKLYKVCASIIEGGAEEKPWMAMLWATKSEVESFGGRLMRVSKQEKTQV